MQSLSVQFFFPAHARNQRHNLECCNLRWKGDHTEYIWPCGGKKNQECELLLYDKLSFYTYHGVAVHPIIMPWVEKLCTLQIQKKAWMVEEIPS